MLELIVRLGYFASWRLWHDPWLCFDIVVIGCPAVEIWVLRPMGWNAGMESRRKRAWNRSREAKNLLKPAEIKAKMAFFDARRHGHGDEHLPGLPRRARCGDVGEHQVVSAALLVGSWAEMQLKVFAFLAFFPRFRHVFDALGPLFRMALRGFGPRKPRPWASGTRSTASWWSSSTC